MGRYILVRLLKSIFSIAVVVCIVVVLVYKLVPTTRVFEMDDNYRRQSGNIKTVYMYNKLKLLHYLDFLEIGDMFAKESKQPLGNKTDKDPEYQRVLQVYRDRGYTVERLDKNDAKRGQYIAYRYYNSFELIGGFFSRLFVIDTPHAIQDETRPDLKRGYAWEKDPKGFWALTCSGCKYKYQLYFDGKFPFIHQNAFKLNFGEAYPMRDGVDSLRFIGGGQGQDVRIEQTFPTGYTMKSAINQYTRQYKSQPNSLDKKKYGDDPYAKTDNYKESPSMIGTSYKIGLIALFFCYLIALPFGIAMARKKGKLVDKIGIVYINILLALPSLALIYFVGYLGKHLGLPDKFPIFGFSDARSYVLPVLILAILGTPGLMMWLRRYMVDQQTSDYVKFAKAKGLTDREIARRHILKNAIIPIVNGIPGSIILALTGAVITESLFAVPGMGKMLPDAIKSSCNNMVITLTFIFTALSVFSVFIGDLLMTVVDPRISLDVKEGVR